MSGLPPARPGASHALGSAADSLLNLLFPPRCIICESLGGLDCLCTQCIEKIEPVDSPACPTCGLTMTPHGEKLRLDTQSPFDRPRRRSSTAHLIDPSIPAPHFCPHCSERTPSFDKAGSLGAYRGVLRNAIHHLKYRDKPQLARPLAALLADYARSNATMFNNLHFDSVLAVPIHQTRKKQRGYNQAERLAAAFCKETGLTQERELVRRSRTTRSQVGLSATERIANMTDAFTVTDPARSAGKTYLIVDDVLTTGSTLNSCAQVLKTSGANAVFCLTIAAD